MTQKTVEVKFIEIPGVDIPVRPEALCRRAGLAEAQVYAQQNGLVVLNSPEINKIANFLEKEDPDEEWVKQQAEKLKVSEETIRNVYASFRKDVWWKYWLITAEVLVLPPFSETRLDYPELDRKSKKPILLRDCRVLEKEVKSALDMEFVLSGGEIIEVDWPLKDGVIPKNLVELLNARDDTMVFVESKEGFYESERTVAWDFRFRMGVEVESYFGPLEWGSRGAFLMGRSAR